MIAYTLYEMLLFYWELIKDILKIIGL